MHCTAFSDVVEDPKTQNQRGKSPNPTQPRKAEPKPNPDFYS